MLHGQQFSSECLIGVVDGASPYLKMITKEIEIVNLFFIYITEIHFRISLGKLV